MEVQIISNTVQKFNGESFYKCGKYFQHKGKRLHRCVWEYHNGKIPNGYHVHHIDGNRLNNSIDNLKLLIGKEHISMHMSQPDVVEHSKETVKKAREFAAEWHKSDDGKRWHSKQGKKIWDNLKPIIKVCAWCGNEYQTLYYGNRGKDTYCCANHKASALRWRKKHEGKTDYPYRKT